MMQMVNSPVTGKAGRSLPQGLRTRLDRLRAEPEAGAQVAEYAMLGGVSAAACGALVSIFTNGTLLERIVSAVINVLIDVVKGWF